VCCAVAPLTIGKQTRNPLLFPLCSSNSDFASDADDNEITQLPPTLTDDEFLSSKYSNSGASSTGSDGNGSDGSYLASLLQYHKDAFYKAYNPIWERVQKSTHLISQEKYDKILRIVTSTREKNEPPLIYKYCQQYSVGRNIEGRLLY
jgi:hypothetical protein